MKSSAYAPWHNLEGWRRCTLALVTCVAVLGCDKKAPPDPHILDGYRLLSSDPQAAYDTLSQAREPSAPKVLLGRGLALERLRKYEQAEKLLRQAHQKTEDPLASLALARVSVALGKLDVARKLVDSVVRAVPAELSALLLETCLAHDQARAEAALSHLDRWQAAAQGKSGAAAKPPGEYYVARMSLFRQLGRHADFEAAAKKAKRANLSKETTALALVQLAVKAKRRDLALELLGEIEDETHSPGVRRQAAILAHHLGARRLVDRILGSLTGDDEELLRLRAEHEFASGSVAAERALRRALKATKDEDKRARLQFFLAEALLRIGKVDEARQETEALFEKNPDERAALFLARLDLAEGKTEDALKRLQPLVKRKDPPIPALEIAALTHVQLGQPEKARPLLESLLQQRPTHGRAARLLVALDVEHGNPEGALRAIKGLVSRAPRDVGLRLLLAEAIGEAEGDAAAVRSLRESVERISDEARLWMALVEALQRQGAEEEALTVLEQAHDELPQATVLTAALAMTLAKVGKSERAASLYERLTKEVRGDPVALNNLAILYADQLDKPDRAVELAQRAHRLSQAPAIVDTLGWTLFRRGRAGDLEHAQTHLQSVRNELTSPTSKYHLGAVLIARGKPDEGKALLRQALAQSQDFAEAEQARRLLAIDS